MMRICVSLGSDKDIDSVPEGMMIEARTDLVSDPEVMARSSLITFREPFLSDTIPDGFKGMIDIGIQERPNTDLKVIASVHDYDSTPDRKTIVSMLKGMNADVVKGAFAVDSFRDLHNLFQASLEIHKPHVLLGMGETGTVTRIRQSILKNEFTFAYVGKPTAPGQLSAEEMKELGDDCMIVGITGDPVSKSLSPRMHNAAFSAKGINGTYLRFQSPDLENIEDVMDEYQIRGINVTVPHKQAAVDHLDSISRNASEIGAVNTIVNDGGKMRGFNTDAFGIHRALKDSDFQPEGSRALIMGSGGAARACAYVLRELGCRVTIVGRNKDTCKAIAKEMGCEHRNGSSVSLMMHDLVINCTPIGMYDDGEYPVRMEGLGKNQTVFDMVYGTETPLLNAARAAGAKTIEGKEMLIYQGSASFGLWTGEKDVSDIMRGALE